MHSSNKTFCQSSISNLFKPRKALNPIFARRIYFSSQYHRQNWPLPDSIIFYIAKNPSSAKLFQKLVQSCKFFFIKNSIIIIDRSYNHGFFYDRGNKELEAVLEKIQICENFSCKFWISGDVIGPTSKIISSIIPYIYIVDVKKIHVYGQTVSYNDFLCFAEYIKNLTSINSNFKNENDSNIPLEQLVEALPNLKGFFLMV
uniref:Uncharacterized protein n=1 Tax=Panagrolaimus davidi TaxID=227884 RepID=A0A914Q997_9BILA